MGARLAAWEDEALEPERENLAAAEEFCGCGLFESYEVSTVLPTFLSGGQYYGQTRKKLLSTGNCGAKLLNIWEIHLSAAGRKTTRNWSVKGRCANGTTTRRRYELRCLLNLTKIQPSRRLDLIGIPFNLFLTISLQASRHGVLPIVRRWIRQAPVRPLPPTPAETTI